MKKIFLDLDGTLAKFNVPNALKRFEIEKGFFARLGAYKNIDKINEMAKAGNVYIISASPNIYADLDKMTWIKKYLPNVIIEIVIFCRLGINKARYIEIILKIIRLTTVSDNSRGLWKGLTLADLGRLATLVA